MANDMESRITISGEIDAALERAIRTAVERLESLSTETLQAASAADQLDIAIGAQELELKNLKRQYASLVLEQGEESAEARECAERIRNLSGELQENRTRLRNAERAADELDTTLDRLDDAARRADESFTVFKGTMANLASSAIQSAVSGLENLAKDTIQTGISFSSMMSEVAAISGATGDDLQKLESTAKEYGSTTVFSASEAAEALKYMALAGWDVEQSTGALGGVLDLAAASGMDLAAASDMVTDYMSAFNMETDKSAYFADILAKAQSASNTSAEQLGEAYKNCAASLNAAGQDVETVTSLLEGMANQGRKGSEAGTSLNAMMRDLTAKMKNGKVSIGKTAVSVMDASGNFRDLTEILQDVEKATDGLGDAERAAALSNVFTSDSITGLNLILNESMDKVAGYEEALRNADGTAKAMSETMNDNLEGDLNSLASAFEGLQLKIFDGLEDPLRKAVQFATNKGIPALTWLADNMDIVAIAATGIGASVLAFKWTSVIGMLGNVSRAVIGLNAAMAANPIGAAILAVTALVAAGVLLYKNWDTVKEKALQLETYVSEKWTALKTNAKNAAEEVKQTFTENFNQLLSIVEAPLNKIQTLLSGIGNKFNSIKTKAENVLSKVSGGSITIPTFANGGFTNGISIAGESGTEAVISFDSAYRDENIGYWAKAGEMLGVAVDSGETLSNSTISNRVNIDGITFAPQITVTGNANKQDIMAAIEAEFPEFTDLLERWFSERGLFAYVN